MTPPRTLSPATTAVLKAVADGVRYGFDVMEATALPSGTVYPILSRLERGAMLRARWESHAIAQREKRPPRRYYEITAAGTRTLAMALAHYRALGSAAGLRRPARG